MGSQLNIAELIADIGKGDLILPEFQRGYVWKSDQVKGYLESLYRGYPSGSFLIWKTANPGLARGADTRAPGIFNLILDGQQRLTSVYTLVKGEPPPFYEGENLYFNLHFNVRTEEFSYYKKSLMKGQVEWLPVTPFLQKGLGEYLGPGGPCSDEDRAFLWEFLPRLTQLEKVKSYSYYLDTLAEKEMDTVVTIFNLVNSKGTPLTKADLALSHICALWPEARQEMRSLKQSHEAVGFHFDLNFYVRCTSAVATESGMFEPLYKLDVKQIKKAFFRAKQTLDYLLNTLRAHAYIDSSISLSSDYVLVPLVVYLANGNKKFVDERERQDFLHWMYAALMWSRYSGPTETKLNQDLQVLKGANPASTLRAAIIAERGRLRVEGRDLANSGMRTSFAIMAYIVARHRGAIDWVTGSALYETNLGKSNGLEYHHIFPQSLLYAPKGKYNPNVPADRYRVNEIANIAFLTKAGNIDISNKNPADYLPRVQQRYSQALERQFLPQSTSLWETERFEDFLGERRELIAGAINAFMEGLIAERPQQVRTVADYIAEGESETVEFKQSMRWDYRQGAVNKALEKVIAKTLAGFMNAKGGTLVVGVSDEGEVVGLEADVQTLGRKDLDGWEQHLRALLNSHLSKDLCAMVTSTFPVVDGKTVALLHIDKQIKPAYLMENGLAEFYVRSGNTTQLFDVKQANAYIAAQFPILV